MIILSIGTSTKKIPCGVDFWEQNFERLWDVNENQVKKFCSGQNTDKIWYETI